MEHWVWYQYSVNSSIVKSWHWRRPWNVKSGNHVIESEGCVLVLAIWQNIWQPCSVFIVIDRRMGLWNFLPWLRLVTSPDKFQMCSSMENFELQEVCRKKDILKLPWVSEISKPACRTQICKNSIGKFGKSHFFIQRLSHFATKCSKSIVWWYIFLLFIKTYFRILKVKSGKRYRSQAHNHIPSSQKLCGCVIHF